MKFLTIRGPGDITVRVIADSKSFYDNSRIISFENDYHRFIHAEVMTHREFSRNTMSSRAVPVETMIKHVQTMPAIPIHWGQNQRGMQAEHQVDQQTMERARQMWIDNAGNAVTQAHQLHELKIHKQIANRGLEPYQMIKPLITSTSYHNWFNLRNHPDAQPEIKALAECMLIAYQISEPEVLYLNEWHTPYVSHERDSLGTLFYFIWTEDKDGQPAKQYLTTEQAQKISCSCAAQTSYRKHDNSLDKAMDIFDKLVHSDPVHASAFEHVASPMPINSSWDTPTNLALIQEHYPKGVTATSTTKDNTFYSGNFKNWIQYRQLIDNHDCQQYSNISDSSIRLRDDIKVSWE